MGRKIFLFSLFLVIFILAYLGLCYMVPGWRIKLDAEPMVYFIESIKSMVLIKTVISVFAGLFVTVAVAKLSKIRDGQRV